MGSNNLHFGGVPFDPDIKKIRESYPDSDLTVGQVIPYESVERILGVKKDSSRFRGVTTSWRKRVNEEAGVRVEVEKGVGFKVLDEEEKVDYSYSRLKQAFRKMKDSFRRASEVDRSQISEDSCKKVDQVETTAGKALAYSQLAPRSKKPNALED